jgi:very-short-patch-repair endonuclease
MREYNKNNVVLAKNLRKNMTPQEKHLWYDFLKSYDVRFQRQKPLGNYIADFFCAEACLVVEIDGAGHGEEEQFRTDEERTAYLESVGLTVIRFTNEDINKRFIPVCQEIDRVVKKLRKSQGAPEQIEE